MNTLKSILAAALVAFPTAAVADPDPAHFPMDRAIIEVTENLADHPNRGLANAQARIVRNIERQQERDLRHQSFDRVERPERPERIERVEFLSARDFGRAHRPERPDRPGKK
jgi:hypothetical protein